MTRFTLQKGAPPARSDEHSAYHPQVVDQQNNRIWFYADIERENILKLTKSLMEMDSNQIASAMANSDEHLRPIYLHINSMGGYIFDGLAAMDQIAMTKCPVYTVVDGVCASAATFLSIRGKKRYIKENSFMLIHQISSGMWGKYEEFVDEMENLKKFMGLVRDIYAKHTHIPKKVVDEMLLHDIFFNAKECIKYGLVDEIIK